VRRFQLDSQWQRDFAELSRALAECREHTAAGCMLRDAGVMDEAQAELALADEAKERMELLEHALRDL
jgi:hypothetical protein